VSGAVRPVLYVCAGSALRHEGETHVFALSRIYVRESLKRFAL
jgi:hypothetical protein